MIIVPTWLFALETIWQRIQPNFFWRERFYLRLSNNSLTSITSRLNSKFGKKGHGVTQNESHLFPVTALCLACCGLFLIAQICAHWTQRKAVCGLNKWRHGESWALLTKPAGGNFQLCSCICVFGHYLMIYICFYYSVSISQPQKLSLYTSTLFTISDFLWHSFFFVFLYLYGILVIMRKIIDVDWKKKILKVFVYFEPWAWRRLSRLRFVLECFQSTGIQSILVTKHWKLHCWKFYCFLWTKRSPK